MSPNLDQQLTELFGYTEPNAAQRKSIVAIRTAVAHAARVIFSEAPRCSDQTAAIRLLRQAAHMANAAVVKPHAGNL